MVQLHNFQKSSKYGGFDMTEVIPLEVDEVDEFADRKNPAKMKVECVCPMCGKKHTMNILNKAGFGEFLHAKRTMRIYYTRITRSLF